MNYQIKLVKNRIKSSKFLYSLIFIQIFMGVAILLIALNVSNYINQNHKDLINNQQDMVYSIRAEHKGDTLTHAIPQTTLKQLLLMDNANISVSFDLDLISFAGTSSSIDGEKILDTYIIKYTNDVDKVYASENFLSTLSQTTSENTVNFEDLAFILKNNHLVFDENNDVEINIYEDSLDNVHILKIPIKYFYEFQNVSSHIKPVVDIKLNTTDTVEVNNTLYAIEHLLNEGNKDYYFRLDSEYFEFLKDATKSKEQSDLGILFSALLIIMVYTGISALFILLIEKRSFEISVSLAVGAKISSIISQFMMEFLLIAFLPALSAVIILNVFIKDMMFVNVVIPAISLQSSVIVVGGIVLVMVIFLIPIIAKLIRLKPYEFID